MADRIAKHVRRARWSAGLLLLLVVGTTPAWAGGLVYRIEREGAEPSFLVGTMHSEDPRVTGLLAELTPLIERVDTVAIELIPDAVTLIAIGAATLLPLDQSLRDTIGATRFRALRDAARQRDIPIEMLDRLKPWAVAVMLGMPASQTGRVLDMEIYLEALRQRRSVVGLESAAEQLKAFDDMPADLQIALLDDMIKNIHRVPKQLEEMTTAYVQGDLGDLERQARGQYADMPAGVAHWFDEVLLASRNRRMLARVGELLDRQPVMIAVGALHLGGESGLVAGLRDRGYRVVRWDP